MISDPRVHPQLAADLNAAEADKLEAYQDTLGNWTIGRGHLLPRPAPGKSWAGFVISEDVSDRYFLGDILSAIAFAQELPEYKSGALDTDCRKNAVVELCFNMRGKWGTFTSTRAAIQAQNWQAAHDGLLDSLWAKQVGPTRANRLAQYLLIGQYP